MSKIENLKYFSKILKFKYFEVTGSNSDFEVFRTSRKYPRLNFSKIFKLGNFKFISFNSEILKISSSNISKIFKFLKNLYFQIFQKLFNFDCFLKFQKIEAKGNRLLGFCRFCHFHAKKSKNRQKPNSAFGFHTKNRKSTKTD